MDGKFTQDELQWIYNTIEKALLEDDYDLVCRHCLGRLIGNCRAIYCNNIKTRLRQLVEK
jgi:hypothetical protein